MTTTRTTRHYKIGSYQSRAFGSKVYSIKRIRESTIQSFNFRNCKKFPITIIYGCSSLESFVGRTRRQALLLFNRKYEGQDYYLLTGEYRIEKSGIRILFVSNENNSLSNSVFLPFIDLSRYNKIKANRKYVETDSYGDKLHSISSETLKYSKNSSGQINNYCKIAGFIMLAFVTIALAQPFKSGLENKLAVSVNQTSEVASAPNKKYEANSVRRDTIGRYLVLVNPTIYDSLTTELNQHVIDLEQDGYIPSVISSSFNSAESLRAFLKQKYDQDTLNPLKGAVFVGNMPFTKFQTKSYSAPDSIYQCFPCETFFGDVDGTWLDNKRAVVVNDTWRLIPGQDSIYDTHIAGQGDKETEIFLGRLDASNMVMGNSIFGNEIQRLRDYFQRLHSYWEGNLARDTTALVYFDDDWANPIIVNSARDKAQMVYSNTITISDSNTTAAQNYKQVQLPHGYEFMWLAAHSNPAAQMFKENNGTSWGYVDNFEIPGINPQSLFYLFNCCNLLDFSVENIYNDFMANQYIFSSNKGLALIGYTARAPPPIGATYDSLWAKLASHKSFGEGLEAHIDEYINRNWTYNSESYATAIIGVPTVKLHRQYQPGIEEPEQVVREINDKRIKIYPTVFKDKVIVKYSNGFEEELEKRLDIYSIDGRKVKDIDLSNYIGRYNSGNIPIDLSDLNKGVYFARIGNNARDVEKIVKQ